MNSDMVTWRGLITKTLESNGETWSDVADHTLTCSELEREFDDGYGSNKGSPFTLWTRNRVYFPACYDGHEWVESVSRDPDGISTLHVGG